MCAIDHSFALAGKRSEPLYLTNLPKSMQQFIFPPVLPYLSGGGPAIPADWRFISEFAVSTHGRLILKKYPCEI